MIGTIFFQPEPLPSMWKVILFRIWQAEQRDRILSDWEDNVFGIHLSREEIAALPGDRRRKKHIKGPIRELDPAKRVFSACSRLEERDHNGVVSGRAS